MSHSLLERYEWLLSLDGSLSEMKAAVLNAGGNETDIADLHSALIWRRSGRPRFVLSDSIAALLSVTRAPPFENLPFEAFFVEVPRRFMITGDNSPHLPCWIFAGRVNGTNNMLVSVGASADSGVACWFILENGVPVEEEEALRHSGDAEQQASMRLALRLLGNVVAYISQHREATSVRRPPKSGPKHQIIDVRVPRDVTVDRAFRDLAAAVVSARSFRAARQALSHMVRGHWRLQAVGEGRAERRLTWVRPHRRGDESLGRVVSRIERMAVRT